MIRVGGKKSRKIQLISMQIRWYLLKSIHFNRDSDNSMNFNGHLLKSMHINEFSYKSMDFDGNQLKLRKCNDSKRNPWKINGKHLKLIEIHWFNRNQLKFIDPYISMEIYGNPWIPRVLVVDVGEKLVAELVGRWCEDCQTSDDRCLPTIYRLRLCCRALAGNLWKW